VQGILLLMKGGLDVGRTKFNLNHKDYRSIWLTNGELKALGLLAKLKYLTQKQFYRLIKLYNDDHYITEGAFHNRMRKFEGIQLVNRHYLDVYQKEMGYNYLSVGKEGAAILNSEGITDFHVNPIHNPPANVRKAVHDLAAQDLLVDLIDYWYTYHPDDKSHLMVHKPSAILKLAKEKGIASVIPDALCSCDGQFIALELDTGSEKPSEVVDKVRNYILTCQELTGIKPMILIAVLDKSFPAPLIKETRYQRVVSLKKALVSDSFIRASDLDVYVASLTRAREIGKRYMAHNRRNEDGEYDARIKMGIDFMRLQKSFDYEFILEDAKDSLSDWLLEKPIGLYSVYSRAREKIEDYMTVYYVEEGNICDFYTVESAHHDTLSTGVLDRIGRALIIYENEEELVEDPTGKHYESVLYSYMDALNGKFAPSFYRSTSMYKRGKTPFEKGILVT